MLAVNLGQNSMPGSNSEHIEFIPHHSDNTLMMQCCELQIGYHLSRDFERYDASGESQTKDYP